MVEPLADKRVTMGQSESDREASHQPAVFLRPQTRKSLMTDSLEVVHVITATQLIDSESYEHTLGTKHVNRLPPGFYVVHWQSTAAVSRYDERADFVGPFDTRHSAELAVNSIGE